MGLGSAAWEAASLAQIGVARVGTAFQLEPLYVWLEGELNSLLLKLDILLAAITALFGTCFFVELLPDIRPLEGLGLFGVVDLRLCLEFRINSAGFD